MYENTYVLLQIHVAFRPVAVLLIKHQPVPGFGRFLKAVEIGLFKF